MNFFCSVEHAHAWAAAAERPGRTLALAEVVAAAPALWGMMRD